MPPDDPDDDLDDDLDDLDLPLAPPYEPAARSTLNGTNRFRTPLYLAVTPQKTLQPVELRRQAHYVVTLELEYPTYEEELHARKQNTRFIEEHSVHQLDIDALVAWRVRRALCRWNLHRVIPNFTRRLHRVHGFLTDESMEAFRTLPPLVRKAIQDTINGYLGPF